MSDVATPIQAPTLASEAEAIAAAHALASRIAPTASERDRSRELPREELRWLDASGLLGITVPREFGGLDCSCVTLAEVTRILSRADPSVGQIPQNHFVFVDVLRANGSEEQKAHYFGAILAGARLGNALSERGVKRGSYKTSLRSDGRGGYVLNGTKSYCTGASTAAIIPVFAKDEDEHLVVAYLDRDAEGIEALEDWNAMGQRGTGSGTTIFTDVHVAPEQVVQHWRTFEEPQLFGARGQLVHVAIDVGIAADALEDAAEFVRTRSRVWFEAGVEKASEDPHVIRRFGELQVRLHAAEAMLRRAAEILDDSQERALKEGATSAESAAAASLAVAEAKVFAAEVAVEISSELFELAGTSATDEKYNLHRHWRNARTHTLHDPNVWKYHHAGNFLLNGIAPPNHGLI
jgi:SfnB family sulfur acquisition oxidoreductase